MAFICVNLCRVPIGRVSHFLMSLRRDLQFSSLAHPGAFMADTELITQLDRLTPTWLTERLRGCGVLQDGAVTAVHPVHLTTTHVSSHYRIAVDYDPTATAGRPPRHLFLKLANPTFVANSDHETVFYNSLVPQMQRDWRGPWPFVTCYDAAWSAEEQVNHLLLEDLSATHATHTAHAPPTPAAAQQLIDSYAAFHAFWWEHPTLGVTVGSFLTEAIIDRFEADARQQLEALAEQGSDDLTPEEFACLRQAVVAWPPRRRHRVLAHQGITLVHRDPHPGNILYPHNPATHSLKLIDWQSWRIDTGTDDLAYLMAFHWPAETRAVQEATLLRRYHAQLMALGVTGYSWDDCLYDYRASIVRFLSTMLLHWRHQANRERCKLGLQAFVDWECAQILA